MGSRTTALVVALLGASLVACGGGSGGGGDSDTEVAAGCGPLVGDGNETFDTADPIAANTPVADSINGAIANNRGTGADPFDIFEFLVPTGGDYDVRVDWADSAIDIDVEIYNLAIDNTDPIREGLAVNTNFELVEDIAANGGDELHILVFVRDSGCVAVDYTLTVL